jgi:MFS transporter, ACS family, D-galactonate transporter
MQSSGDLMDGRHPPVVTRRWGMLAFLMLIAFMGHFNRISISVAGTERLGEQYRLSEEKLGLIYSSFVFMYTFSMAPGGWLVDRIGAVKALTIMGFSFAVLQASTGLVSLFPEASVVFFAFIAIRGIAGVTSAPLHPGASRVISRWMPPGEQPLANGMVTASAVAGISSTYYVFGWLMDEFGWPSAFVIAGAATIVVIFLWTLFAVEHPATQPPEHRTTGVGIEHRPAPGPDDSVRSAPVVRRDSSLTSQLLKNRNLLCLTLSYSSVGYFQYIFFFWIEHLFMNVMLLDKQTSRTYSTIALLSMSVGMLLGGWIANRLSEFDLRVPGLALVPIAGMLISAVSVVLSGTTTDPEGVLFWFSLGMAGIGACEGPMWTLAVRMGRHSGGTAAGIFNTGGNVGGIVSPVLTPLLGRYLGWEKGLWIASALCVMGAILWFWIDIREDAPTPLEGDADVADDSIR